MRRTVDSRAAIHLWPRGVAAITSLVMCVSLAVMTPTAQASYVSVNKAGVWASKGDLASVADGYYKAAVQARVAGGGCSNWATDGTQAFLAALLYYKKFRITPFGVVATIWSHAVAHLFGWFSGLDFCDIAKKAAPASAWATYYAKAGGAWSWIYIWHETRTLRPDRCHIYNGYALPGAKAYTWVVWDLVSGCSGD